MSVIKGFFFDLDGTLVNTYEADFLAYRDAIKEVAGINIEQADFARTHGQEMRQKLERLAPGIPEDQIAAIGASKKKHYPNYLHLTKPNAELVGFIKTLAEGHVTALVTTARQQNAMLVLEHHSLANHFREFVFGDEVDQAKPHPEAYLKALEKTKLQPHEAIAFEDSSTGIESAAAAGIQCIRIGSFV